MLVHIPGAAENKGEACAMNVAFPTRMEHRLVVFPDDRAEAVHATHVVNAVHARTILSIKARPI
jgi:hypothetical protein